MEQQYCDVDIYSVCTGGARQGRHDAMHTAVDQVLHKSVIQASYLMLGLLFALLVLKDVSK